MICPAIISKNILEMIAMTIPKIANLALLLDFIAITPKRIDAIKQITAAGK